MTSSRGKEDQKAKRKRHRSFDGDPQPTIKFARSSDYEQTMTEALNICISSASSLQIRAPGEPHRVETWNYRNDEVLGAQQYTRL